MGKRTIKTKVGVVLSDKGDKSAVVGVDRMIKHPVFKKYISKRKKLHIHDANNECQVGDVVEILECRPISKTKSWRLNKVVKKVEVL